VRPASDLGEARLVARQSSFAEALLDPARPLPAGLRSANGSDPAARFAVHRNNVVVSLVEALGDAFPVTRELVGAEFFAAMALPYVRAEPPRSPILAGYGETFPAFVARFGPAAALPYLADVARLEWLRVAAFHAADAAPRTAADIACCIQACAALHEVVLHLHPSLAGLVSRHPVVALWAAHQGIGSLAEIDLECAQSALVLREGEDVVVVEIDAGTARFIEVLRVGDSLADAVERAAHFGDRVDPGAALGLLVQRGALVGWRTAAEAAA